MIDEGENTGIDHSNFKFSENMKKAETQSVAQEQSTVKITKAEAPFNHESLKEQRRVMHELRYAELIDKLRNNGESLSDDDKTLISHSLERRNWGGILKNLKKGDTVISTLSSTSELLSIKNLNDNIFGPSTTDEIIFMRRELTISKLDFALNSAGVSSSDREHTSLEQNYKFGVFKIPKEHNLDVVSIFNKICAEVDVEIKELVITLVEKEIKQNEKRLDELEKKIKGTELSVAEKETIEDEIKKAKKKKSNLPIFKTKVDQEGYRMTFGIAKVESDDIQDIIVAANGSLQTARAATFESAQGYGDKFSDEKMTASIDQINETKRKLFEEGNTIIDSDGIEHKIFEGEVGKLTLNRDLLREIRKNKFACEKGQENVLEEVKNYVKSLNIFDVVKPFTAEEIPAIEKGIADDNETAEGIFKNEKNKFAKAADALDRNDKDNNFTSQTRFHAESVKIKNCAYLSLDVLDVGVDQLLDYEQLVQEVTDKKISFTAASIKAGDNMTKKLREVRQKAFDICNKLKITKNERMNGLVGGDELTLAIDLDAVDENGKKIFDDGDKVLNKLIHDLKKGTDSRVVKTVIAESHRFSSSNNEIERMKEHITALKKAEDGTTQAKEVENELRKLNKFIKQNPDNMMAEILKNSLENFVVAEVDDHFVIRTENGPDLNLTEILQKFKAIQKE